MMKKNKKRALACFLAGMMLFALSACGETQTEEKKTVSGENTVANGVVKTLFNEGVTVEDNSTAATVREGNIIEVPTMYYQQFGADPSLGDDAALTYGGWKKTNLPINADKTAIVVMHAAYVGEAETAPEQFQYCEYVPRSYRLAKENFPAVLDAARAAGIKLWEQKQTIPRVQKQPVTTSSRSCITSRTIM